MGDGIYTKEKTHLNIKCIIFSTIMMGMYYVSSKYGNGNINRYLMPIIFVTAYIAMGWYDYLYNCDERLYSGSTGVLAMFSSIFKPQYRKSKSKKVESKKVELVDDQEEVYMRYVYFFHIIAIAPLLIYVGYKGKKVNKDIFPVILSFGVGALVYHGFRLVSPREKFKK
jgi:hypothetical protein